ncbi:MAG: hypothetical protein OXF46_08120 [Rhodobacteraceae bacterium]|nr:hypothetical protein [Paracoccaceae bacterium]
MALRLLPRLSHLNFFSFSHVVLHPLHDFQQEIIAPTDLFQLASH